MRTPLLSLLLLAPAVVLMAGRSVSAQSLSARQSSRREADECIENIRSGIAVQRQLSRLTFLGEQRYAAHALVDDVDVRDDRMRRNVAEALGVLAVPGTEQALTELAGDPDPFVRMSALQGLGRVKIRQPRVLLAHLKDSNAGVRRAAAQGLGALRRKDTGKPLLAAAHREAEPEVRSAMLEAVGQSGDLSRAKALESFLHASSESARASAARGLCLMGAPAGFAYARKQLASSDKYTRRQALLLFEGAKAKTSAPVLTPLLGDSDPAVQAAAARILYQGGEARMALWLVAASDRAKLENKGPYETELELLQLTDEQRSALRKQAAGL